MPAEPTNNPPSANAGPDQTVLIGDTVTLDGSRSHDDDGNPLTFVWSLVSVPTGSTAALSDSTGDTAIFVFVPDVPAPMSYSYD